MTAKLYTGNTLYATVEENCRPQRIYDYLRNNMSLSASLIKKVKYGRTFLNGEAVTMRATVYPGDKIKVELPRLASENVRPIEMPIDVIYEDEHFIAVNKPSDMPTHPSRANHLPTLAEGLSAYFAPDPFVFRAINRLDRDTSGIVIVAKNAFSANELSKVMKSSGFIKKYDAVVTGILTEKTGIIDAPIARLSEGNIKRGVLESGKRAITEFRVTKEYENGNSLVELTLHTGRTHQIRVHMAYIGHPLYNDFLYGVRCEGGTYRLHAKSISFINPFTKEEMTLTSPSGFE